MLHFYVFKMMLVDAASQELPASYGNQVLTGDQSHLLSTPCEKWNNTYSYSVPVLCTMDYTTGTRVCRFLKAGFKNRFLDKYVKFENRFLKFKKPVLDTRICM
jgi:hypothetical protein